MVPAPEICGESDEAAKPRAASPQRRFSGDIAYLEEWLAAEAA
jgi:hypothetical protein